MSSSFHTLPQGWQVKTLGEVCKITMGQSPKGEQVFSYNKISSCLSDLECNEREESQKDSTLKDISATHQCGNSKNGNDFMEFHQGKICFTDKYLSESEFVTTDIKKFAEKDSILLCVRAPVGIINITKRKVAIGRGLCALKMKNQNNDFLYFYLLTLENYFNQKATGSTFSAITMNVVKNTPIPLPPLEVQKAIVEKLENAFAHIDEAVRHLKAVQTNIPRLKSSLLHSAFNGKLTESHYDYHSKALAKESKDNNTHTLPQGWEVKTLGECLEYEQPTKYIVKNTQYSDEYEIPVLTAGKSFLLGYTNDIENIFTQIPVIIFDDFTTDSKFVDFHFKVKSSAMKILHATKIANIKFVFYFMQTIQYRSDTHKRYWISEYAKLPIPLPPLATQNQIVQILESNFAHLEKLAQFVNESLENLQRLKSSLLNQAFKGELV